MHLARTRPAPLHRQPVLGREPVPVALRRGQRDAQLVKLDVVRDGGADADAGRVRGGAVERDEVAHGVVGVLALEEGDEDEAGGDAGGGLDDGGAAAEVDEGVRLHVRRAVARVEAVRGDGRVVVVRVRAAGERDAEVVVGREEGRVAEGVHGVRPDELLEVAALVRGVRGEAFCARRGMRARGGGETSEKTHQG